MTLHGVFVDVLGLGVLLTGYSGIGKSELGLSLIDRGHRLIADDCVIFMKNTQNEIIGSCPPMLQDFLEVRGLGILNIRAMFGDDAIREHKRLQLIVNIVRIPDEELQLIDRLHGMHRNYQMFDCSIPEVSVPVAPGRNLSILVESAVRNQILKKNGYEATEEFMQRQDVALLSQNNGPCHEHTSQE